MVYIYIFLLTVAKIVEGVWITPLPYNGFLMNKVSNDDELRLESKTIRRNITFYNNTIIGNKVKILFNGPDFGFWHFSKNKFSSTAFETGTFISLNHLKNGRILLSSNKFNMSRFLISFTNLTNTDLIIKKNHFSNGLYETKAKTYIHKVSLKSLIITNNAFKNNVVRLSDSVIHILVITNNTFNNSEFTCKNVAANYYYVTNNFTNSENCFLRFRVDLETAMSMTPEFKWSDVPKKTCHEKVVPVKRPIIKPVPRPTPATTTLSTTPLTTTESTTEKTTTETIPTTKIVTEIPTTFQTRNFSTQYTSRATTEKPDNKTDDTPEKKPEHKIISSVAFSNAIVIVISFAIFFELNVLIILVFIFRWRAKMFATQKITEL
ncbi:hypothetical protein [Carp edema virus]|nr:hypothetical protein [Carp edema virus]